MKNKTWIVGMLLLAFPLLVLQAQPRSGSQGYRIQITIPDFTDTTVYLANYYGDKTYMTDTAFADVKGKAVFEGLEPLPGGIYILAIGKNRVIEFIVNKEQRFELSTSGPDFVENMKISGSPENQLFFDYMRFNSSKYKEVQPIQKELKELKEDDPRAQELRNSLQAINDEVEKYKADLVDQHPQSFIASFFKAMREPEVPDAPILPDGRKDSTFAYRYYKSHYWDGTDLADDRLLRTPVFHGKLDRYFEKVLMQQVDTLIAEADRIIALSRPNKEMFKYLVWYLTIKYETSKVMGFDEIFVHMVDRYYSTGEAYWVNETVKTNITERANILRPILLGRTAPNMIMLDTNRVPVALHNIQAKYTIILFWDTECGHCKKETPKLKKFYEEEKDKYGFEVFAVCTDTSYAKMKKYVREGGWKWVNVNGPRTLTGDYHDTYDVYSTPVIYLLDEKKKIIAKRLLTDQLADFIRRYDAQEAPRREE
ncbi:MAG TPA: DUF5106 domain-containing protein [Bacteroidales bacterium]|nr:DUF5106 domain-containing protein [Bacteroidales bacterium]